MGESPAPGLRPRLALRFGIKGHRPPCLARDHHQAAASACAGIFAETKQVLADIYSEHSELFSDEAPLIRLISALASGADTVAAKAAMDSGIALSACLPFPKPIYSRDLSKEDWRLAEELAIEADSALAITYYEAGDDAAYEAVGRLVLAQSDILIAIWDGEPARGRRGTTDVVAEAIARHIPVIHINPDGSQAPILLWSGLHEEIPDQPSIDGTGRAPLDKALPMVIGALCAPPQDGELSSLRSFLDHDGERRESCFAWPLLLVATGARSLKAAQFRTPSFRAARSYFAPIIEPFQQLGDFGQKLTGALAYRFAVADASASASGLQFRSSFVTNFSLAATAVLLALSGLFFPDLKAWLITAELLVIALIIVNTRRDVKCNFHKLWINRRHLAERLRLLGLSATLGRLSLRDVEDGTTFPGWVTWYARPTARELDLPPGHLDKEYLARVRESALLLIDDQVSYHRSNARVMAHTNNTLHRIGDWLFIGTILFCLAFLAAKIFASAPVEILGISLTAIVTLPTAFFPALAAALYGFRMQGDFAATSERSRLIAARLRKLRHSLAQDSLTYGRLVERIRRLSEIMLSDIHQWQQQY